MLTVDDVLLYLRESTDPALTWYGADGERVELSGKVLDNWVSKTANLLLEEFDVEAGSSVALRLPAHWKSIVIALAALAAGGTLTGADAGGADVLATAEQAAITTATGPVLAVALGALELSYPAQLPAGAVDYAANVRMYADSFARFSDPAPADPAITGSFALGRDIGNPTAGAAAAPAIVTFAEVVPWSRAAAPGASDGGDRVALCAEDGLPDALRIALACWANRGSVLLYSAAYKENTTAEQLHSLLDQERAVHR